MNTLPIKLSIVSDFPEITVLDAVVSYVALPLCKSFCLQHSKLLIITNVWLGW